jgi:hypothetical protein
LTHNYIAFAGDIDIGDMEIFTDNPFKNIPATLSGLSYVINSDAVFLAKSYIGKGAKQEDQTSEGHLKVCTLLSLGFRKLVVV